MTETEKQNDLIWKLRNLAEEAGPGSSRDLAMDCVREIKRAQRLGAEVERLKELENGYVDTITDLSVKNTRLGVELSEAVELIESVPERAPLGLDFWDRARAVIAKYREPT